MKERPHYDLIIIGGGILGMTLARDAAQTGKRVLLLEKGRFGSGASSKTSKLAHGGLRYLEQAEFGLVSESVHERDTLVKDAPHAVKPLPFIIPVYKNSRRPFWQIKIGLWIYSFFSRKGTMPAHKILSKSDIKSYAPELDISNLTGAALYYDAQMDDDGLVWDVMAQATAYGATCKAFHTLTKIIPAASKNDPTTLEITHSRNTTTVTADKVLLATGAWGNHVLKDSLKDETVIVRPSKGSHIVIKPHLSSAAITLTSPVDGRVFFVIPYKGYTLIGTTESDFTGSPDAVSITEDEKEYLLKSASHFFPATPLQKSDILWSFSGLRPLSANSGGAHATQASRELSIQLIRPTLWSVSGGKYTTFQAISRKIMTTLYSKKILSKISPSLPINKAKFKLRDFIFVHDGFLKIAHRGFCRDASIVENSMPAFETAIAEGATMIECDLQLTDSGSIVIFHDDDGSRVCGNPKRIQECTDSEIKEMTFTQSPEAHPPFLHHLLERVQDTGTYLYLELKTKEGDETAMRVFERSLKMVQAYGLTETVWFAAFDSQLLCDISKKYPDVLLAWNVEFREIFDKYKENIQKFTSIICPSKELFTDAEFKDLIQDGWKVVPFTIKTEKDASRFKTITVSGLTSDSLFLLN